MKHPNKGRGEMEENYDDFYDIYDFSKTFAPEK
jgi:hypothetical protein